MSDRYLRRKLTFRAHGHQVIFIKNSQEKASHVWMKAFLWALYLPMFPEMHVEVRIGIRYKPDVVALDTWQAPMFWGESGQVGAEKLAHIVRRYRSTYFAFAKWDSNISHFVAAVKSAIDGVNRAAPIDILRFPADSVDRFIDDSGTIQLEFNQVELHRFAANV